MIKKNIAVSVIAAFSLFASGTGTAEDNFNQVGLFTTSDGTGVSSTIEMGVPVDVYLVLTNPTDVEGGNTPFAAINAFECTLTFSPTPNNDLFLAGEEFLPGTVSLGENRDINQGFLEYYVGTDSNWPVADESIALISFVFINTNPAMTVITLGPTTVPTIEGQMAFEGVAGQPLVMYPARGSHSEPAFTFNGMIAVESDRFGSIKALFR